MNPWSIYWRQGHSTTFGDWFSQGYDGAVADRWLAQLESEPSPLTIVELGCGTGTTAQLLARQPRRSPPLCR